MKSSDSGKFTCNLCGAEAARPAEGLDRETPGCASCGSSVRLRALVALLSQELFGLQMTLPEFPALKSIRGLGMTDPPALAGLLAEKFDYTNTFYHQAPRFDITQPGQRDFGRYDFILSSEVMEHVPPPAERAFSHLYQLLKPDGLLLLTTPYTLGGKTVEHFPQLHQYALATVAGRTVLVNRRRDGSVEVFEDLTFHGGEGSTLEMRVFSEASLRSCLELAGFGSVQVAATNWPEFGVEHAHAWSLPMVARKGCFMLPVSELARGYRDVFRRATQTGHQLAEVQGDYDRYAAFHNQSHDEMAQEIERRTEWARKIEHDLEQRTQWAKNLERENDEALAAYEREKASEAEAWGCVARIEKELEETRSALNRLRRAFWTRVGRKLRLLRYSK